MNKKKERVRDIYVVISLGVKWGEVSVEVLKIIEFLLFTDSV